MWIALNHCAYAEADSNWPHCTEQRHYHIMYNTHFLFHFSNHRILNIEHGITLPEYYIALPGYTSLQTSSSRPAASGSERVALQHLREELRTSIEYSANVQCSTVHRGKRGGIRAYVGFES
jgi:hypothetical protein